MLEAVTAKSVWFELSFDPDSDVLRVEKVPSSRSRAGWAVSAEYAHKRDACYFILKSRQFCPFPEM